MPRRPGRPDRADGRTGRRDAARDLPRQRPTVVVGGSTVWSARWRAPPRIVTLGSRPPLSSSGPRVPSVLRPRRAVPVPSHGAASRIWVPTRRLAGGSARRRPCRVEITWRLRLWTGDRLQTTSAVRTHVDSDADTHPGTESNADAGQHDDDGKPDVIAVYATEQHEPDDHAADDPYRGAASNCIRRLPHVAHGPAEQTRPGPSRWDEGPGSRSAWRRASSGPRAPVGHAGPETSPAIDALCSPIAALWTSGATGGKPLH